MIHRFADLPTSPRAARQGVGVATPASVRNGLGSPYQETGRLSQARVQATNGRQRSAVRSVYRGYAGAYEYVDLFYSPSCGGARNRLPNGYCLGNLTGIYFLWDGRAGQGQTTNNNIASHRWSNNC